MTPRQELLNDPCSQQPAGFGRRPLPLHGVGFFQPGTAQDATPGVVGTEAASTCVTDLGTADVPDGASAFTIVSEESLARYRAQEELASIGANEAVGETNAIIGSILFGGDGSPLACSRFDVDLRTLTSDEARRDNFLYNNTLQTGQYPLATFILASVEGLDGPLMDGDETALTLVGNITVHGQTDLIAWDATVTLDGDTLAGTATTTCTMDEYGIDEPVVGPVMSVDETITLEVEIAAERAA
jgi:polyisoprenoid-binding protein YceI